MYTTQRYTAFISVEDYLANYVDIPTFLDCCKACPNYEHIWSCPSYTFDVSNYWKQYCTLELIGEKITFSDEMTAKTYTKKELDQIMDQSLYKVKRELSLELLDAEKSFPGSVSLSAGSCSVCQGGCTRPEGKPCRFPETMRYSIESLGGNVGMTISKLMGIKLEWMEEGKLPPYFVLVCGLLHN